MCEIRPVAILGASSNPGRYAWLALKLLKEQNYPIIPVSAKYDVVGGIPTISNLSAAPEKIHTITVYLNPLHLNGYVDQILAAKPERVIFNPGSESPEVKRKLRAAGIDVMEACTLVLLRTGQF